MLNLTAKTKNRMSLSIKCVPPVPLATNKNLCQILITPYKLRWKYFIYLKLTITTPLNGKICLLNYFIWDSTSPNCNSGTGYKVVFKSVGLHSSPVRDNSEPRIGLQKIVKAKLQLSQEANIYKLHVFLLIDPEKNGLLGRVVLA